MTEHAKESAPAPAASTTGGAVHSPAATPGTRLRLATWNINSIRARVDRVTEWLVREDVDVLAMQETKCRDDQFPFDDFEALGYEVAHVGYNQWNGVAIASRIGLMDVEEHFPGQPGFAKDPAAEQPVEARAVSAFVGAEEDFGGLRLWSLYAPNGRELTDRHYDYKLRWMEALRQAADTWLTEGVDGETDGAVRLALVGDWNVAPLDTDVWDMEVFEGKTHVSQPERDAFAALLEDGVGLAEPTRAFAPDAGTYTYWDYQQLCFPKNKGMRIDFQLLSPALAARVAESVIHRDERKGSGASDHVPVVVDLIL